MSQDGKDGFDWVSIMANTHGPQRKEGVSLVIDNSGEEQLI